MFLIVRLAAKAVDGQVGNYVGEWPYFVAKQLIMLIHSDNNGLLFVAKNGSQGIQALYGLVGMLLIVFCHNYFSASASAVNVIKISVMPNVGLFVGTGTDAVGVDVTPGVGVAVP